MTYAKKHPAVEWALRPLVWCLSAALTVGCTGHFSGLSTDASHEASAAEAPAPGPQPAHPATSATPASPASGLPPASTSPSAAVLSLDVTGCSAGDYNVGVRIGGQDYHLRLDTGANITAVAAASCSNCGVTPTYTPGATAKSANLSLKEGYADGSGWVGDIFTDQLTLGAQGQSFPLRFAAISQQAFNASGRGYFFDSGCQSTSDLNASQGTLGLGNSVQNSAADDLADVARGATGLADIFAVQLCDLGGHMWWGGFDPAATASAPRYTPMDTTSPFDYVALQDLSVAGQPLGVAAGGPLKMMVDTGTNAMLLPEAVFGPLASALAASPVFAATFGAGFLGSGACQKLPAGMTLDQLDQSLPRMGLIFADEAGQRWTADLPATGSYLLRQMTASDPVVCSAVVNSGSEGGLTFGNEAMHSQVVIFDRAHQRMGLAPEVGCPAR